MFKMFKVIKRQLWKFHREQKILKGRGKFEKNHMETVELKSMTLITQNQKNNKLGNRWEENI